MGAEWVSVREVGRRRGVTHGAVQKAIKDGRIPETAVKRDAEGNIEAIEYEAAIAAWNANTDLDQAARTIGGAATVAAAGTGGDLAGELPLEGRGETKTAGSGTPSADVAAVRAVNAEGKRLQNQLLELELAGQIGLVVPRDEVFALAQRRYRAIRDRILTVPDRVADILAAERDPARVHAELTKELERALHELSDAAEAEAAGMAPRETAERVAA